MIFPSMDKLENWGNRYALATLAAKRAKQLKSGAPPLVETNSKNPLTIALEEIAAGKITCVIPEEDMVVRPTVEPEVAELLAIPIEQEEKAETQPEELLSATADTVSDLDQKTTEEVETDELEEEDQELEEEEEEYEEEEEEEEEWHAALDEELIEEDLIVDETPLAHDDEATLDIEPDIVDVDIAAPILDEDDLKPKTKRGRKSSIDDIDFDIPSPLIDADIEEADEEDAE